MAFPGALLQFMENNACLASDSEKEAVIEAEGIGQSLNRLSKLNCIEDDPG